ncbi:DUF6443 domain-containing protein [Flavobacterium sp. GSA192]|uniref:DUF6443 domain-containing protein n=1 Tax=Flavobacterium sp. GSA192 TaxID=2576304 RepID=UPI00112E81A0|nr:DUF6443 domain-containing protein [Flavobacterium sp. GSA192]
MNNKKVNRYFVIWIITLVVLLCTNPIHAQQYHIQGPTTVNYGETVSYTLGNMVGDYEEIWWGGDVNVLNNDTGYESTVNVLWDIYIEKAVWFNVSYYNVNTDQYYYDETTVAVLPPTPTEPTVLSASCNEVVLQRTSPPIFTSSYPYGWGFVNDVIWYWQSTADGTSTANSASTITLTSGNQYFLRAKSIADYGEDYGTWSAASSSVSYTIGNPAPLVGTITQPTSSTPTGSVVLSGLPSTGTWTINPGGISGTGTSTTVSGLTASNAYNFTVSTSTCTSAPSANVVINAQPLGVVTPTLSTVTQPTSTTSTGSFTITNYNASYSYSANPSTGVVISGAVVTAPQGTYVIVATSGGTSSSPSASVTVNAQSIICAGLSNENYIHTIIPQTATTDISSLVSSEKQESVTYFDSFGRPKQKVAVRASGFGNKDIITHIAYDALGRQTKEYLPYADENSCGMFRTGDIDALTKNFYFVDKYEYNTSPYSEKELEASPLSRVLKQASPGQDWAIGAGHEIKFNYLTNLETDQVRSYEVVLGKSIVNNTVTYVPVLQNSISYYSEYELYKMITKDENWVSGYNHTTEEFKDKQGRVVLKRTYDANIPHDTYYVYDDYGNLTYVFPPKMEATTASVSTINSLLSDLGYQYKYDQRNRLVEKKLPGKQWEYIVYDKLDRPVLTQDANLKAQNKWLFTKYDVFNRPVYSGEYTKITQNSRVDLQGLVDTATTLFETKTGSNSINGTTVYYSNNVFPNADINLFTINYYDDYIFDIDGGTSVVSYGETPITNVKGLATGGKVRILGTTNWITNVNYYDVKGRLIFNSSKNNFLEAINAVKSKYDFTGKVIETTNTHQRNNMITTVVDSFTYDNQGRLLTQTQKINNQDEERIFTNEYDQLGQLSKKGVGGKATAANRLQTVDYNYNARGWLKGINDVNTIGNDLFAFKINYNNPTDLTKALFNGNISQTIWKTLNTDTSLKNYIYSYDDLNRLSSAVDNMARYNESLSYDKNGNIMSLLRKGYTDDIASQLGIMDNLTYVYDSGNKLFSVEDSSGSTEGFKDSSHTTQEYNYDANGNMNRDDNKGITTIAYNHLNLPTDVTFEGGTIHYDYDATGAKQRKIAAGIITDYAGGFQYEKLGANSEVLKFFPTAEGYAENNNGTFSYIYQYKDHLGNVRLSYKDSNNDGVVTTAEIVEESAYYPFGLKHKVAGEVVNQTSYKYKYNGKELQDDNIVGQQLNWYDYHARNYDPALGRWMNIDPLAEKSRRFSPYNYALDNPVYFIDPDGMEAIGGVPLAQLEKLRKNTMGISDLSDAEWIAASRPDGYYNSDSDNGSMASEIGESEESNVQKQKSTTEEEVKKMLKKHKKGAKIDIDDFGLGIPTLAKKLISNIERVSETKFKINRTFAGKLALSENAGFIIEKNGILVEGDSKKQGLKITPYGLPKSEIKFEDGTVHSYNSFILVNDKIIYGHNGKFYNTSASF